jgi:hypothetical protein
MDFADGDDWGFAYAASVMVRVVTSVGVFVSAFFMQNNITFRGHSYHLLRKDWARPRPRSPVQNPIKFNFFDTFQRLPPQKETPFGLLLHAKCSVPTFALTVQMDAHLNSAAFFAFGARSAPKQSFFVPFKGVSLALLVASLYPLSLL